MEKEQNILRHWKITRDETGVLLLQIDRSDASVNTLSSEVLDELGACLDGILREPPAGLIVCSAKSNGFIAGADVKEFSSISSAQEAQARTERVHELFDRIEHLPFPSVCLVHGFCLGGGFELALAFGSIVAVDAPETQFGLPEVLLGIHPGFGGTARLIRRIGPVRALDLMLRGRSLDARRALQAGLVDAAVPEHQGMHAAMAMIQNAAPRRKVRSLHSFLQLWPCRQLLAWYLRRVVAKRADRNHYPAPYALLDLWQKHGGSQRSMDRAEARSVAQLVVSDSARNLARVFLLRERLQSLGRRGGDRVHSVHVIGGGIMGGDIAAWCALQGFKVSIQDIEPQRLGNSVKRAADLFRSKLRDGRLVDAAVDRLVPDFSGKNLSRADVVIEAIFEDAAAKRRVYQEIEPRMRRDALLATNTSSIPLETLAESLQFPGRFVGLHFFNPVANMPLVEVARGRDLTEGSFNDAMAFVSAIRRLPLPVASSPGFLINRILTPYLLEAFLMEQEGVRKSAIDRAARAFGMPMGPLLLADTVGLDICLSVGRNLSSYLGLEIPRNLERLVGAGRLGRKTHGGFYGYDAKGKPQIPREKGTDPGSEALAERMMLRLLNEAVACLREGIVQDGDLLDAGAIFGIGFAPFRGGPTHYIRSEGAALLESRLQKYESRLGRRFAPDSGWKSLAGPSSETVIRNLERRGDPVKHAADLLDPLACGGRVKAIL
jgi:3-hydroxyacyl-CoA dehydrogenase / enoyl-CoA hydratase / 3-hydroxybutyryl-CoA epimerase